MLPEEGLLLTLQVATAITAMESRLKAIQKGGERPLTDKEELALRLNKQYPQDVGVLSAFFLNLVKLQAGQVRLYDVWEMQPLVPTCICKSVQARPYLVAVRLLPHCRCGVIGPLAHVIPQQRGGRRLTGSRGEGNNSLVYVQTLLHLV